MSVAILLRGWLRRKLFQSMLELVDHFQRGDQAVGCAGKLRIEIKNSGSTLAKGMRIELLVYKPDYISVGNGLFFNTYLGSLKSSEVPKIWHLSKKPEPKKYRYRLKPTVTIIPGEPPQQIAYINIFASPNTPPASLDHEIEWTISHAGWRSKGKIIRKGSDLKRMLMINANESGQEIDYDQRFGKLPKLSEDKSE
jgi:hypothetical protein